MLFVGVYSMTDKKQTHAATPQGSRSASQNVTVEERLKFSVKKLRGCSVCDYLEAKDILDMARAEEREKCKYDFGKMFVDAAKDAEEKGRREEAEKNARGTFSGSVWENAKQVEYERGRHETTKEIKAWFLEIELLLPEEEERFDKRFLRKEKEANK